MLFKVFKFSNDICIGAYDSNNKLVEKFNNSKELLKSPILTDNTNFTPSKVFNGFEEYLNQSSRVSLTNNYKFKAQIPEEVKKFFVSSGIIFNDTTNIYDNFTLLKYEPGGFFKKHIDNQLMLNHLYTCLLFFPNELYEEGDMIFTDTNTHDGDNFYLRFHPSKTEYTLVIFSLDLYHEIQPVLKHCRHVLKKPLFVNYIESKKIEPKAFGSRCSTSRNNKSLPFKLSIQNGQTKFAEHSEMIKSFEPKIELVNDDEQEGMEMDIGHNGSDY